MMDSRLHGSFGVITCGACQLKALKPECLILVGSGLFGATFYLVTLKINTLPSNNCFSHRNVLQNGVSALSKMVLKELGFLTKNSNFVHFRPYDLVQFRQHVVQIMYEETLDLQC